MKDCVQIGMPIAGRLAASLLKNWSKVTQDHWVLNTVQGYRLEFLREPVPSFCPKGVVTSSSQEQSLNYEEVLKMLQKGAITKATPTEVDPGFYSSLFLVPKKDGGTRPVMNLKCLNEYIVPHHFKMEGIHTLWVLLKKKQLDDKSRPKGCLLYDSNSQIPQTDALPLCKRASLPVHMPAIRSFLCSLDFLPRP